MHAIQNLQGVNLSSREDPIERHIQWLSAIISFLGTNHYAVKILINKNSASACRLKYFCEFLKAFDVPNRRTIDYKCIFIFELFSFFIPNA